MCQTILDARKDLVKVRLFIMFCVFVLLLVFAAVNTAVVDILLTQTCKIHTKPYPSGVAIHTLQLITLRYL
jgi:uncharacterized integral membrane protein